MNCTLLILASLISLGWAFSDNRPRETCAGGVRQGETVERGRYWYLCDQGDLLPKGCLTEGRTRLNLYETTKIAGYVLECAANAKGDVSFKYKSCLSDKDVEFPPNDTWQDEGFWYVCLVEGEHLRTEIGGCIEKGQRFEIGQRTQKNNQTIECSRHDGTTGWITYTLKK